MDQDPNPRPKWDVHNPHSHLGRVFVITMRKIYHPIGFRKGYNFPLFLIGAGGLMGFVLSRMYYFDINGVFYKVSSHPSNPHSQDRRTSYSNVYGI